MGSEEVHVLRGRLLGLCLRPAFDEAEACIGRELAVRTAPTDRLVLLTLRARIRTHRSRPAEAWADFSAAEAHLADAAPADRTAFYDARGMFALDLGQVDRAARDFAVRSSADDGLEAKCNATMLAFAVENFVAAERGARQLAAAKAPNIDAGMMTAMAAMARYRQARRDPSVRTAVLAEFEQALRDSTQPSVHTSIHLATGRIALEDGDIAAAEAAIARAQAVTGDDSTETARQLAVLRCCVELRRDPDPKVLRDLAAELRRFLDQQRRSWLALPVQASGIGFLQFADHREPAALSIAIERRLHPDDPAAGLAIVFELESVSTLARRLGATTATLERVRETMLPQDGGALFALPTLAGSWVFLITSDAVMAEPLDRLEDLKVLARQLRADLVDDDPATRNDRLEQLRKRGREAAALLLPESMRARVQALRQLVVVGNSLIDDLPIEVLPGVAGGWLGTDLAISYVPSFAAGVALVERSRAAATTSRRELLLFAANQPADTALPAFALGDFVAKLPAGTTTAEVFEGSAATVDAFAAAAKPTTFACIIGHGTAVQPTRDDDRDSALAVAGDTGAALRCRDVEAARLDAQCLLLGSCGGARGAHRIGDDASNHLAGAFLQAGAAAVVAGDLDLDLQATLQTAGDLRTAFATGCSTAEALRRARVAALARPDADPSTVFALRALGAAHLPVQLPPEQVLRGSALVGALLGIAAIALGAMVWRRRR